MPQDTTGRYGRQREMYELVRQLQAIIGDEWRYANAHPGTRAYLFRINELRDRVCDLAVELSHGLPPKERTD